MLVGLSHVPSSIKIINLISGHHLRLKPFRFFKKLKWWTFLITVQEANLSDHTPYVGGEGLVCPFHEEISKVLCLVEVSTLNISVKFFHIKLSHPCLYGLSLCTVYFHSVMSERWLFPPSLAHEIAQNVLAGGSFRVSFTGWHDDKDAYFS